jgi:7-cyano-7-deazaguanine reductase
MRKGEKTMAGRKDEELKNLTLLGNQGTKYLFEYSPEVLEVFENKHPDRDYFVKFNCPEFTSLCQ